MCRLLFIQSVESFDPKPHLKAFSEAAKNSKEFQGHGWGCAYLINDEWQYYKNIDPIWEHSFENIPITTRIVVHARSAFKDEGIVIENNMPFHDDTHVFIFNGELRGVKIKSEGRIGAEKIFNYIKRLSNEQNFQETFKKAIGVIEKRTDYIRAMNIIMATKNSVYISSLFNDDPNYFTLRYFENETIKIVCSEPYSLIDGWKNFDNRSFTEFLI